MEFGYKGKKEDRLCTGEINNASYLDHQMLRARLFRAARMLVANAEYAERGLDAE